MFCVFVCTSTPRSVRLLLYMRDSGRKWIIGSFLGLNSGFVLFCFLPRVLFHIFLVLILGTKKHWTAIANRGMLGQLLAARMGWVIFRLSGIQHYLAFFIQNSFNVFNLFLLISASCYAAGTLYGSSPTWLGTLGLDIPGATTVFFCTHEHSVRACSLIENSLLWRCASIICRLSLLWVW